ncbi:MAG: ATP-binding cassette domain-containing protein [Chitinispirillia bacterium]|nr:ATP-binding cassette domain-containing protein [Chitinispirillia bacterium]MCL2241917.1 ATP-binding cassette domain-containing protein [Chitinispirillia bacterium]
MSLTVPPGGVVVLGGRSGSGKSTLLEICAGLLKPSDGRVAWDGAEVGRMSKYALYALRKSLGYVFQVHALIANHSVFDNIALPLRCGGRDLSGEQIKKRVWAQMEELGIGRDIEKKFPETLSAAQLRSVALARALVSDPKLLILDEPFSGVDPFTSTTIINVLRRRWAKSGMTVIMAAHSMSAWPEWEAGRYQLKDGRLESADEAFPAVRDLKYNQKFTYAK